MLVLTSRMVSLTQRKPLPRNRIWVFSLLQSFFAVTATETSLASIQRLFANALRILATILLGLSVASCQMPSDSVRPEALPTRFEHVHTGRGTPVDLNGDGIDEHLVRISQNGLPSPQKFNALLLESGSRTVIDQVNYAHPIGQPHTADITGDGTKEVFVPLVRNDSLFLSIVTADGTKRNQIYVTEGTPRREPDGILPWDPKVKDVFWTDTDGNGTRELLTLVQTRYARLPRGVWIHELPSGRLLGKKVVGAALDQHELGNFDDDSHRELLVAAGAPNNGANAGGMSDKHAYVYAFDLGHPPSVQWKQKTGSKYVRSRLEIGDLDGDGVRDYVVFESPRGRISPTRFRLIDPGTGETRRASKFPFSAAKSVTADADEDGRDEVLVLDRSGTLHVLGASLVEEERVDFGSRAKGIDRVPDVTGDGNAEVLLSLGNQTRMLGPDLRIRAAVSRTGSWRRVRRGPSSQPFLRVDHGEGKTTYQLVPNRWYWLYRWGPWGLGLLAVGLLLAGGYGAWNKYREYHRLRALQESTVAAVGTPLLLCREGDGSRVRPLNQPGRRWLRQSKGSREEDFPKELASENGRPLGLLPNGETGSYSDLPSSLASWIRSLDGGTEQAHEAEFPRNSNPQSTRVYARAVSIPTILGEDDSCWLLRVLPPGHQADLDSRRTWRLMAQRIAHDLRNPLTSIRLALQSMQMAYREAETDVAGTLDAYVEQIDEQIESLRRSATNVMKLVGAEEQNALETDLSSFLRREAQQLAEDLPDDVELRWELADDLPVVSVDREQMTSVLENLVYNAVEALPEGGAITVQTQLARDLLSFSGEGSRDYVIVEVMDTGTGMNASTRTRAFDPGFTTTAEGTGLGLAMVKRIIEDHDGQVELESEPGMGTDVRIYLPIDEHQ